MTIIQEADEAIFRAMRLSDFVPREVQTILLFNTEGQNEWLEALLKQGIYHRDNMLMIERRYRGAIIAVTHDREMPKLTVIVRKK